MERCRSCLNVKGLQMNWSDSIQAAEDEELFSELPSLPDEVRTFARPEEISINWHKTQNQGRLGSCQGSDLSSILERHAHLRGESVQLSRIFCYLATQKLDNLLGNDSGSTIAGGARLALETGAPLESSTGYPSSYPGRRDRGRILSSENYEAAAQYRAASSWKVSGSHEEALGFIASGGGISFGVSWYRGLIPSNRIVREFRPRRGGGGHAMAVLGYTRENNLRAVNSHGDGPFLITPGAWAQMLKHPRTRAIGLLGVQKPQPIDWEQDSPYYQ